jgi:hypothetical protein
MSWKAGASLGTFRNGSQATAQSFSAQIPTANLPRFRLFPVFLLVVVLVSVFVFVVAEVVIIVVDLVVTIVDQPGQWLVEMSASRTRRHHVVGSAAGFGFGGAGGGYVVQKCRPHFGHTQN